MNVVSYLVSGVTLHSAVKTLVLVVLKGRTDQGTRLSCSGYITRAKKRNRNQNCELSWSWLWSPSLMPYGSISIGEASWLYKRCSHHCVQLRDSLACHRCPADIFGSESLQTSSPFGCCSTKTRKYSVSGKVWQESFRRFHLRC